MAEETGLSLALSGVSHGAIWAPTRQNLSKVIFKPACSATETSYKIEFSLVASLYMIVSNKLITTALVRLCGCAGWSAPLLLANP